jgi:hypothetical protein
MGWMSFVNSLVGNLAWPIVVMSFAILFRTQLGVLIGRVNTISFRDIKVGLSSAVLSVTEAEQEATRRQSQKPSTRKEHEILVQPPTRAGLKALLKKGARTDADVDVTADLHVESGVRVVVPGNPAIPPEPPHLSLTNTPLVDSPPLADWNELKDLIPAAPSFVVHLTGEVLDEAVRKAANKPFPLGSLSITRSLDHDSRISKQLVDAIFQLQRFRNLIAGNNGAGVTTLDARTYVENVEKVIHLLEDSLSK